MIAYTGPVVVGNAGDNSVSSYRLHASETQQLPYDPTAGADLCGVAMAVNQCRADLQHNLATQRLRYRYSAQQVCCEHCFDEKITTQAF